MVGLIESSWMIMLVKLLNEKQWEIGWGTNFNYSSDKKPRGLASNIM